MLTSPCPRPQQRLLRRFHTLVGVSHLLALEFGPGWRALLQGDVDPTEVIRLFPHLCSSRYAPGPSAAVPAAQVLAPGHSDGGLPERAPPGQLPKPSKVLPAAAASEEHGGAATAQNLSAAAAALSLPVRPCHVARPPHPPPRWPFLLPVAAVLERRGREGGEGRDAGPAPTTGAWNSQESVASLLQAAEGHLMSALESARQRFARAEAAEVCSLPLPPFGGSARAGISPRGGPGPIPPPSA